MTTYRNKHFTQRDYECANVVACESDKPLDQSDWEECSPDELRGLTPLWLEADVRYYGYL